MKKNNGFLLQDALFALFVILICSCLLAQGISTLYFQKDLKINERLRRNGFTLIEALLALFITGLVSLLGCMLVSCALHFAHMDMDTQNQFAILQLRRELSVASEVKVENEQLEYILNHEKFRLYFDKHRIVKSPGYEIYMEQIDLGYFYQKEDGYYLWFKKKNKIYDFEIY